MKAFRFLLVLILLSLTLGLSAFTCYLKESVEIAPGPVRLRDVLRPSASLSELPPGVLDEALAVTDGRLALIPARVVRKKLEELVRRDVLVTGKRVQVIPQVLIRQGSSSFYSALLSHLNAIDPEPNSYLEAEVITAPDIAPEFLISEPQFRNLDKKSSDAPYLKGDKDFYFDYLKDALPAGDGIVTLRFHSFLPVAVAVKDLSSDERLVADSLRYEEKDTLALADDVLTESAFSDALKVSQPVKKGEVIPLKKLSRMDQVKSGDRVQIVFVRKNIRLTLPGTANKSGNPGDLIPVQPVSSEERFMGRIRTGKEVLVEVN
jgi:flagella basal body P-ring formation protein FlgA